jgi:branched-chain amino acid transport system substrate-binding protein
MQRLMVAVIVMLAAALGHPARAEVLIGVAGPMTGKLTWTGEQLKAGSQMAVADLNAAGGVLGQQVRVIIADDFCDPDQAVAAAHKLVDDGVVLVVGHYCSGASIPASEVYEAAGVLMISPASTNPLLTEQGRANDHWRDNKVAILHDNTTYGKGLADETKKQLNKRGVTEAIYQAYTPGLDDYSPVIAGLQAADIAVLYVGGYHTEVALMARAASERGYPVQIVSGDAMATEEFALIAGSAAEGTLFTFAADPRRNVEAAPIVERFRAENFEPDSYTLLSYGAVQAWAQAVEKAGSLELQAVIPSLRTHQFDTVLGRIDFDDKGDLAAQSWVWYVWRDGEYVPLE